MGQGPIRIYKDNQGWRVVEVYDLSFLTYRNHPYNWFQRHFYHHRLRIMLKGAVRILAASDTIAKDLHRFYFIPYDRIALI